jgi:hypothetical protein
MAALVYATSHCSRSLTAVPTAVVPDGCFCGGVDPATPPPPPAAVAAAAEPVSRNSVASAACTMPLARLMYWLALIRGASTTPAAPAAPAALALVLALARSRMAGLDAAAVSRKQNESAPPVPACGTMVADSPIDMSGAFDSVSEVPGGWNQSAHSG